MVAFVPPPDPRHPSHLWDPFRQRYRMVYPSGRSRFRGRVWVDGAAVNVGSAASPREAAALVARTLTDRLGPDWPARHREQVSAARSRSARSRWTPRPYRVRLDPATGLYRLTVYVRGRPRPVAPPRAAGFPTRAAAEAFYHNWFRGEFGLFAAAELWRTPPDSICQTPPG